MYQYRDRSYDYNYGHGTEYILGGRNSVVDFKNFAILSLICKHTAACVTVTNFIDNTYSFGKFLNGDYPIVYPIDVNFMHTIYNLVRADASPESY